ncbi:hypothetical protein POJ06DRAFT_266904 [Lipomyces tetrasporus]|uniref:Uncharacterized protein n=1 Tax=Lipomyces tetrasporus TaxID=54092 RepID=A0AAD7QVN2_9ASCO|nr:uncharacterized protein POJ06DRAFT_266904 [Lipomyces tetrasporus]KAJ8102298.1 hypothetical protein POJ06DRAFT_266904 [Lipomyces tetrasporus]
MPVDRELFPESPPGEPRRAAPRPTTSTKQDSATLHDILAHSLHNLDLESANRGRGQIATDPPPPPSSSSLATGSQQHAKVQIPTTCPSRPPPNHFPSPLSPSALRRPHPHARPLFIPQQSSSLSHEAQYLGTASIDPTIVPSPDQSHFSATHQLNYYAQYPRTSLSSDGSSSVQSSMSSSASISPPSSFASAASASAAAAAAAAAASERDLFLQATELDLRIPMLPDPSPLSDPAFFFFNGAGAQESMTEELASRSKGKYRAHSLSPSTATPSRSPSPSSGMAREESFHEYLYRSRARTASPALSSRHGSPRPRPQPIEQVGILATATAPACLAGCLGTATETPVALRVQFREEMLFGDGGCIDDEPLDEDRPDNARHRESQSSVASARESEYEADEDDDADDDVSDEGGDFARGRTPSTTYDLPHKAVRQVRQYDDRDVLVVSPLSDVPRRELFPSINLDDD